MNIMKRTTIQDIAKRAGVTKATVSMVMNNDPRITEATRQKVMKAVQELNYVPNESARKLARGKADVIAVLSPRFTAPFTTSIMEGMEYRARSTGKYVHGIHPYSTRNLPSVLEEEMRWVLYGRKADAVITITQTPTPGMVEEYARMGMPLVLIENGLEGVPTVKYDNEEGGFQAVHHLLSRGRRRIALIVGFHTPGDQLGLYQPPLERMIGYRKALQTHGVEFDPAWVRESRFHEFDDGYNLMRELLGLAKRPDSLFCAAGDIVAMGALKAIREAGLSIPRDFAVVGYDDILAAQMLNPPLTTVRQSPQAMGSEAFDIALSAIDGRLKDKAIPHVVLKPELIVRETA